MPNYGYHLARIRGRLVQSFYELSLPLVVKQRVKCRGDIPINVFSYSGRHRLAEQVASIRSFLVHAGRPNRFIVVSDGTHSANDIQLLRRLDSCVSVEQVPPPPVDAPAGMGPFLRTHFNGKQVALL